MKKSTAKNTWKARERQVAEFFGTRRTPLSGGNGGQTRSDTLHGELFVEQKLRAKHSAITLWDETKKLAAKEGKIPVVTLAEKGRPGFWVLVHSSAFEGVARELPKRC